MFNTNLFGNKETGIHILPHRFYCCMDKNVHLLDKFKLYRHKLEVALIFSLLINILFFQLFKQYENKETVSQQSDLTLTVEDIPITKQEVRVAAPARPVVPIASEDEDLPDDVTIDFTLLDLDDVPPPPPLSRDDSDLYTFVPYDEAPEPIGGYEAILRNLKYPEVGRLAGIEGVVILALQIDVDGSIANTRILKSIGIDYFDQAAIDAVSSVKWKPALQRDMPRKVWISMPLEFKLVRGGE